MSSTIFILVIIIAGLAIITIKKQKKGSLLDSLRSILDPGRSKETLEDIQAKTALEEEEVARLTEILEAKEALATKKAEHKQLQEQIDDLDD